MSSGCGGCVLGGGVGCDGVWVGEGVGIGESGLCRCRGCMVCCCRGVIVGGVQELLDGEKGGRIERGEVKEMVSGLGRE